jgi:hypothetical protein
MQLQQRIEGSGLCLTEVRYSVNGERTTPESVSLTIHWKQKTKEVGSAVYLSYRNAKTTDIGNNNNWQRVVAEEGMNKFMAVVTLNPALSGRS